MGWGGDLWLGLGLRVGLGWVDGVRDEEGRLAGLVRGCF